MRFDFNGLFNPENRFWMFMEKVMNLFFLGFLWLIFSLPVLTAGASTAALFDYTMKLSKDEEGYLFVPFLKNFKRFFVRATAVWLLTLACGCLLAAELYACQFLPGGKWVIFAMRCFIVCLIFIWLLTLVYLFPLFTFKTLPLGEHLKESFFMGIGYLPVSVTILVVFFLAAVAAYFIPVLFMVWFAFAAYASSWFYSYVFGKNETRSVR